VDREVGGRSALSARQAQMKRWRMWRRSSGVPRAPHPPRLAAVTSTSRTVPWSAVAGAAGPGPQPGPRPRKLTYADGTGYRGRCGRPEGEGALGLAQAQGQRGGVAVR
jgi:hypothetical protein